MFFPNRRMTLAYLALLLPPLIMTLLAFATLARVDESEIVVGEPLDATPTPPPDPLDYFQEGVAQQEAGNFAAAEAAYRAALEIDPQLAPVYNALGGLYVAWQRPSEAISLYRQATQLEPETGDYWRNLGIMLANQGQIDKAVAALETAVALAPDDPQLHYELGQVYAYDGRFEQARLAFEQALALNPDALLQTAVAEQLRQLP
jgi:tetratricopeptide (TPR) repeat protein